MAGKFSLLGLALAFPLSGFAESPPPPPGPPEVAKQPDSRGGKHDRDGGKHDRDGGKHDKDGDDFPGKFRKRLDEMAPEERQRFVDNWKRWKEMGDREREKWKERSEEDLKRMDRAVADALKTLGLRLDQDEKEVFSLRYRQERRKIEEQLKKEMEAKRKELSATMLEQLGEEFRARSEPEKGKPATPTPTPAPTMEGAP